MENKTTKIIIGAIIVFALAAGYIHLNYKADKLGAAIPQAVATFSTTLATEISSSATSLTLTSSETADGTDLDGFYGFVIDSGTSSEEFVTATCAETACTSVTRGISVVTGNTAISALQHSHRRGASVKISDHPVLTVLARIMNGDETFPNPLTFDGKLTYTNTETINNDKDLSTKAYVDSAVVSGAVDATLTAKGISEMATAAEINAGTQAGGTSANLFVNPKYLTDSIFKLYLPTTDQKDALAGTGTPSSSNKYCTADALAPYELLANKDTTTTLGTSDTKYPSQKAVKTYADTAIATTFRTSKNGATNLTWNATQTVKTIAHGLGATPKKITFFLNDNDSGSSITAPLSSIAFGNWSPTGQSSFSLYDHGGNDYYWTQSTGDIGTIKGANRIATIIVTVDATNIILTIVSSPDWGININITWAAEAE